jgi:hypothetical protein
MNPDSIEGSGYPLAFKVRNGITPRVASSETPARDIFKVEARTMGGHQKEVLVTEGEGGTVWRLTSDEGAILKGSDLAPFPLAFYNAGLHADFVKRALQIARSKEIALTIDSVKLTNQYYFQGSFFSGTGKGSAEAVTVHVNARSNYSREKVQEILDLAIIASPAHATLAYAQRNTFALYVNGRRCPVIRVASSLASDETDPFKAHNSTPTPLKDTDDMSTIIERIALEENGIALPLLPSEGRVQIVIPGTSSPIDADGLIATTVTPRAGHAFRITCDESSNSGSAPTGLSSIAASIAFCYMTQFTRYIEHRKHKVRAIRFVQTLPFTLTGNASDGSLVGGLEPVDTHVFLNADEPDEVLQNLLEVAENTCYLHAALRSTLPSRVSLVLNGE